MHILIVDDELLARSRLRTLLGDCDARHQVSEAAHAADALAQLNISGGRAVDLVLLDIHMPGQDGLALAQQIRRLPHPPTIVFVTAHADHALSAFELDAVDYLTKPVRLQRLQQALALAKDAPPQLRAPALLGNGVLAWRQGDLDAAEPLLRDGLELARAAGDNATTINALRSLGALAQNRADYREARALLTSSVELAKQLNDIEAESNTYLSLGNVALDQGQHAEADAHYTRSLELSEQISDTLGYAYALDNLGVSAWHRGDLDRASRLADEVMELYQQLGIESGKANVWHRRCLVALESGRLQDAEDHGMRALRVRTAQGEDRAGAFVLYDLARVALARGDSELARSRLRQGLKLALPHGAPVIDVLYLEGTAAYLEQVGEYGDAYLLLAAAETWRARIGVPVAPVVLKSQSALGASLAARHDAYGRARLEERARDASPAELTALVSRLLEA